MKSKTLSLIGLFAAALSLYAAPAFAVSVTLSNTPTGTSEFSFGNNEDLSSTTYGEVIQAPITGELTSFTLLLSAEPSEGTYGPILGGVGVWNGTGVSSILYTSSAVTAAPTNTFSPDVSVVAGQEYVIFLSTEGLSTTPFFETGSPRGTSTSGLIGFAFNDAFFGTGYGNSTWTIGLTGDNIVTSATFSSTSTIPEPSTWAMMLLGFAGLGFAGYRSRKAASIAA
jgi:PEP-CTERM motif